ncbi:PepSY domain-containing protein, partial [Rhizobium ruizarguesonis]
MTLKLLVALAAASAAAAPALAFARPSCTKEPQSKWMSEDSMKAKIDQMGYKVRTFEITGNRIEIDFSAIAGLVLAVD